MSPHSAVLSKTRANMCVDNNVAAEALHAETNKTRTSENKPGFSEFIRSCLIFGFIFMRQWIKISQNCMQFQIIYLLHKT